MELFGNPSTSFLSVPVIPEPANEPLPFNTREIFESENSKEANQALRHLTEEFNPHAKMNAFQWVRVDTDTFELLEDESDD